MPATFTIGRPAAGEHIEYYGKYIVQVQGDDALSALASQIGDTMRILRPLDEKQALHRYAPGKWSVKETVGHLSDVERVFSYRALRFGRGDTTPLPGMDENAYAPAGRFDERPWSDLLDEYAAIRAATVALFRGFDAERLTRRGIASDNPFSVRAFAWILAGHELHHRKILIERYGIAG
jgi:hypothetical protein